MQRGGLMPINVCPQAKRHADHKQSVEPAEDEHRVLLPPHMLPRCGPYARCGRCLYAHMNQDAQTETNTSLSEGSRRSGLLAITRHVLTLFFDISDRYAVLRTTSLLLGVMTIHLPASGNMMLMVAVGAPCLAPPPLSL